jgi:hypothetical protein
VKHFKLREFACKCGCGILPQNHLMDLADQIREEWGSALDVRSGARCLKHTMHLRATGIPAKLQSAHLSGEAVDLAPVAASNVKQFQDFCTKKLEEWNCWMEDPTCTPGWAHIQVRPTRKRVFKP